MGDSMREGFFPAPFPSLAERLEAGEPLGVADVEALASTSDLIALGLLGDAARRRRHGDRATFLRVADVPLDQPAPAVPSAAGEVRVIGTPREPRAAIAAVAAAHALAGDAPVSGFSLDDLERLAAQDGGPLTAVLRELRTAGLELVAEAPLDRLHDARKACEAAAEAGLIIARLTIHTAGGAAALSILRRAADLQRALGTLRVLAPLLRTPVAGAPSTGYDDVRQVALARLLVDNIDSIQVDWTSHGPKLAQVALTFGADDVDAVSPHETGGPGPRRAPLAEIHRNIRAASLVPVERNGRFQIVGQ